MGSWTRSFKPHLRDRLPLRASNASKTISGLNAAAALQASGASVYSLLSAPARTYSFGVPGSPRLESIGRTCPMTAQIRAQISSKTPNTVSAKPPSAPGPVVVVQRMKDAPETGIATFKPTVPWQYPKMVPSPAASKITDKIRGRSGFIRFTSFRLHAFTTLISFESQILPQNVRVLNLVRSWSNPPRDSHHTQPFPIPE